MNNLEFYDTDPEPFNKEIISESRWIYSLNRGPSRKTIHRFPTLPNNLFEKEFSTVKLLRELRLSNIGCSLVALMEIENNKVNTP